VAGELTHCCNISFSHIQFCRRHAIESKRMFESWKGQDTTNVTSVKPVEHARKYGRKDNKVQFDIEDLLRIGPVV